MNIFDYCTEIAQTSLKAAMKSDFQIDTLESDERLRSLQEDIAFLNEVKDRCTELTNKLANRNITLFKNNSKIFIILLIFIYIFII